MIEKIKSLLKVDIWEVNEKKLPPGLSRILTIVRIISLAYRGFVQDKCQQKASALTFYSLLSIVPVFAMAFGIAKGFGLENRLQNEIIDKASSPQQQQVFEWLLGFAQSMLESTKGGLVAGVGVVILLWSVMSIMGNIEKSFNDIWEVKKSRTWLRKFTDYMAIMIIAPILLVSSSSITVFISSSVDALAEQVEMVSFLSRLTNFALDVLPYLLVWLVFFLIYLIMPNTKVSWQAALTGGIIAGSLFQVFEWVYITFQVGVSRYNAIYGSFAALPLFLVWLQTSWNLVLLGCEMSFASQNYHRFAFEGSIQKMSPEFIKTLGLKVMSEIAKDHEKGVLRDKEELASTLDIPQRLLSKITDELYKAKLIVHADDDEHDGFHPAKDIHKLTIGDFFHAFDQAGLSAFPGLEKEHLKEAQQQVDQVNRLVIDSFSKLVKDM